VLTHLRHPLATLALQAAATAAGNDSNSPGGGGGGGGGALSSIVATTSTTVPLASGRSFGLSSSSHGENLDASSHLESRRRRNLSSSPPQDDFYPFWPGGSFDAVDTDAHSIEFASLDAPHSTALAWSDEDKATWLTDPRRSSAEYYTDAAEATRLS